MKKQLYTISLLLFFALQLAAQNPDGELIRNSKLDLRLSDEKKTFKLKLEANDVISFDLSTKRSVNFRLYDNKEQLVHVAFVNKFLPLKWEKEIETGGIYTVEIEKSIPIPYLSAKVDLKIDHIRKKFTLPRPDSLITPRSEQTFTAGLFKMTRTKKGEENIKNYTYQMGKGDTLFFEMSSISRKTPSIEISNDLGELLYASRPVRGKVSAVLPMMDSCVVNVLLESKALLPKLDSITISRVSPELPALPKPTFVKDTFEIILQDSLPEVYMDTTIFVGAVRDYVNQNERSLTFDFENDTSIIFWAIHFGAGAEFPQEVAQFEPLLEGEALAAGATDILTAYGLGFLKILPGPGFSEMTFTPSQSIANELNPPDRMNYAVIPVAKGTHSLTFNNESLSVGTNVHVKIILFRKEFEIEIADVELDKSSKSPTDETEQ